MIKFVEEVVKDLEYDLNLLLKEGLKTGKLTLTDKKKTVYPLAQVLYIASQRGYTDRDFTRALDNAGVEGNLTMEEVYKMEILLDTF